MNKLAILFIVISFSVAAVIYIGSDNYYLGGGTLILFLLFSFLFYIPKLKRYKKAVDRFHECYHFINNFIISLSIKKAIKPSFENTIMSMNESFRNMLFNLTELGEIEKIRYLNATYFPFHVYRLFIEIIDIYEEEGGDILFMSKYLLQECRLNEEYLNLTSSYTQKKYLDFGILWAISLAILILLRFTLTQFYVYIKEQLFFIIGLSLLAVFIAFSIYLLIKKGTHLDIKGYSENEKII